MDAKELLRKLDKVVDLWIECSYSDEFDAQNDEMIVDYCITYPVHYAIKPYMDNGVIRDLNKDGKPILDFDELGTIEEYIVATYGLDENDDFDDYDL